MATWVVDWGLRGGYLAACFIRVTQVTPWNLVPDSINPAPSRPSCDTLFLLMAITWGPRAGRRCKLAEQVIQITNYGTAAGGKASGLQTFLLGPAACAQNCRWCQISDTRVAKSWVFWLKTKKNKWHVCFTCLSLCLLGSIPSWRVATYSICRDANS